MKILIAEDDLISRRLLQKTLESWGHRVLAAKDGRQAWNILQTNDIRLVIADWVMPFIDGVTLCQKIRKANMPGYVYFIILTGKDRKEDIIVGLEAGADDYVTKPFDRGELQVRVHAGKRILTLEKELSETNEQLQRLNQRLEEMTRVDPLMQIGNRRGFYETVEKVHGHSSRYGRNYSILMCDIDQFKAYNDLYGHMAGDEILKAVASSIRGALRTSDELFRYGGEEIVLILPEQDLEKATVAAGRVRSGIEALGIEHKGSRAGVITISCGVASLLNREYKNDRWETILAHADNALYEAKSAGRNRVCSYTRKLHVSSCELI